MHFIRSRASLQSHILFLEAGEDLFQSLKQYLKSSEICGAYVLTASGVFKSLPFCVKGAPSGGPYTLVGLNGVLSPDTLQTLTCVYFGNGTSYACPLEEGSTVLSRCEVVLGEPHGIKMAYTVHRKNSEAPDGPYNPNGPDGWKGEIG